MSKTSNQTIHIIGGGPAGIAAGYYANKYNIRSNIYESSDAVGGNCKTIKDGDFLFDLGAHRFHDKNKSVTLEIKKILGDDLLDVYSPSKIFWNNNFFDFPLRILDVLSKLDLQTNTKIFIENILNQFKWNVENINFKDVAYNNYGKTLSELFLINYTEKLWGTSTDKLLPNISGGRLKNLNIKSVIKEIILNNRQKSKHLDGKFLYPVNGFGTIFESIKNLNGLHSVYLNSPVTKIIHKNFIIEKIEINNNQAINIKQLICTLPINLLIKMLSPKAENEMLEKANCFDFRGLKLCVIFLDIDRCTDNASIYFPDKKIPFTRLYEPKNRSKNMAPDGKTCIVVEYPYDQLKQSKSDSTIMNNIVKILINKKIIERKNIISEKIIDMPYAYPVISISIQQKITDILNYLKQFKNLHLLGRNAQFEYLHTHDLFSLSDEVIQSIINQ